MAMTNKPEPDVADDNYKRTFNRKKLSDMEEEAADDAPSSEKSSQSAQPTKEVKKLEEESAEGHWKVANKDDEMEDATKVSLGRGPAGIVRHGSAFAFVVGLMGLGVWFSSVFAPNIILVNIKEMFTNDLADATVALYTYDKKMLDHKIGKADCSDKKSIKCKLSTMSRNQVKGLERAGFKVNGEKVEEDNLDDKDKSNDKDESRFKVSSIEFPHGGGSASDSKSFEQNANKSTAMKALTYSVFNPKTSFYQDKRFSQRLKWRYDLDKSITTEGTTEKEVDEAFNASLEGEDENMDDTGGGAYSLRGLAGSVGKDGLKKTSERVGKLAYAYVGLQCAYYTQFKVAHAAAKKAKETTVARFAMQYLKAADQIKSGRSTSLDNEITLNALSAKLTWGNGGYTGKNATDSKMYKHIVFNEPVGVDYPVLTDGSALDLPKYIFPAWLQTVFITGPAVKGIAHIKDSLSMPGDDLTKSSRDYCLEGQKDSNKAANKPNDCPALTTAGTPAPMVPAVAPIAALSDRICPMPPKGCCWMMYPTTKMTSEVVMPYVADIADKAVAEWAKNADENFNADIKGREASEAIFAGTGLVLGDMAMSRGMRPGNKKTMNEYLMSQEAANVQKDFEEIAKYEAQKTPFDIHNQYSFLGSLIAPLRNSLLNDENPSALSAVASVLSLIPTSLTSLDPTAKAFFYIQPRTFDSSRLKCEDQEYKNIGIEADINCSVRYSLSKKDLDAKPKDVLDYMLKSHPNETKKNIDELKKRQQDTDHGADQQDQQDVGRMVQDAEEGSNAKMIDEKTGDPVKHSEYEKFMTYCVNRQDAWGRTGMAVRREEISEQEKDKRRKELDQNDRPIGENRNVGSPYETNIVSGYMAVHEGASGDQDWYTGKKCLEESEMLHNFRAYTMMCMNDGSHSGAIDCTEKDHDTSGYNINGYFNNNDVIYMNGQ